MPPKKVSSLAKKSTSPLSANNPESQRILLTKAITHLTTNRDNFTESIQEYNNITKSIVVDLDLHIDEQHKQLNEMKVNNENTLKDLKIKASQELREFKRKAAMSFFAETNEIPIENDKYAELCHAKDTLSKAHEEELKELREKLAKDSKAELHIVVNSCELRHKAAFAETHAENKMLKQEIANLGTMIEKYKTEIDEQRKLSATIAQSQSKESITQTFGK